MSLDKSAVFTYNNTTKHYGVRILGKLADKFFEKQNENRRFMVYGPELNYGSAVSQLDIVVDVITGVHYLVVANTTNGGIGVTPLLDSYGNVVVSGASDQNNGR